MNPFIFPWPMPPVPMQPTVIRLLAATLPPLPTADEGTKYGNTTEPAAIPVAFFKNPRRLILFFSDIFLTTPTLLTTCNFSVLMIPECRAYFYLKQTAFSSYFYAEHCSVPHFLLSCNVKLVAVTRSSPGVLS